MRCVPLATWLDTTRCRADKRRGPAAMPPCARARICRPAGACGAASFVSQGLTPPGYRPSPRWGLKPVRNDQRVWAICSARAAFADHSVTVDNASIERSARADPAAWTAGSHRASKRASRRGDRDNRTASPPCCHPSWVLAAATWAIWLRRSSEAECRGRCGARVPRRDRVRHGSTVGRAARRSAWRSYRVARGRFARRRRGSR